MESNITLKKVRSISNALSDNEKMKTKGTGKSAANKENA